jgi:hypothetical protein
MLIAEEINGRLYAIHTEHLNTPRRLTNQQGTAHGPMPIAADG